MMEFIVGTQEYMHLKVVETTRQLQNYIGTVAVYDIYPDGEALIPQNAVVSNQPVNELQDNIFKCLVAPDVTWLDGIYSLYLTLVDIPNWLEKPRFGPFRFGVVT